MLSRKERVDIDRYLSDLYQCKMLSENDVKFICEKVYYDKLG
jgi:hypothetical protein